MLSHFLVSELFGLLLVFCRTGSAIMLLPGFGEAYVSPRIRMMLAILVSITLSQVIMLPPVPASTLDLVYVLLAEILIGLFIGGVARLLLATLHTAGSIIALEASLSSSLTQNISSFQGQDTSVGNLLSMAFVVLLFTTDMHHDMLRGLASSYEVFLPGKFPVMDDMAAHAAHLMNSTFQTAIQLAAPNIAIGMMLYLGAGILSRLMPSLQLLAIMAAPQLLLSFFIIMISISGIMLWYLEYFKTMFGALLTPGGVSW